MDIRRTLIEMRRLLTPEGAWCQESCWRNEAGRAVVDMEEAISYCLYGAAQKALSLFMVPDRLTDFLNDHVINYLNHHIPGFGGFIDWNDTKGRTQVEVLALLDKCIADFEPTLEMAPVLVRELEDA